MPTTALHSEMQDNLVGVTTRSRRRLRDGADSSSPAGDLQDRTRYKPYVHLRRSPRHAAAAASRAEKLKSPARHPEFANETPPTSRSTSLVDEDFETASLNPSISRDEKDATYEKSSDRPISAGAHNTSVSSLPIQHVDVIDLTVPDAQTGQKRKRSAEDDTEVGDDEDQMPFDNSLRRVTRSISKRAKLNGPADAIVSSVVAVSRSSRSAAAQRASAEQRRRKRSRKVATEGHEASASIQGLLVPEGNEAVATEEDPQPQVDSPQLAQLVHEVPEGSTLDDTFPISGNRVQALPAPIDDKHPASESVQQALPSCDEIGQPCLPCNPTLGNDEEYQTFTQDVVEPNMAIGREEPNTAMGLQLDGMDILDSAMPSVVGSEEPNTEMGLELNGMDILDSAMPSVVVSEEPNTEMGLELDGMDILDSAMPSVVGSGEPNTEMGLELDGMDDMDSDMPLVCGREGPKSEMGLESDGMDDTDSTMPLFARCEEPKIEMGLKLDDMDGMDSAMPLVGGCEEPKIEMGLELDGMYIVDSAMSSVGGEEPKVEMGFELDAIDTTGSAMSSESSSVDQPSDRPRSLNSSPWRYCGGDGSLLRSQKPPSSCLGPNPVRRELRSSTARSDEGQYLPYAVERAALFTFAQTQRQFPSWMDPSHVFFRGGHFYPHGLPITDQERDIHMESNDVTVRVDTYTPLPSSSGEDLFFQPQTHLYPSSFSYTAPQMALDPDLDPTSLVDGNDFLTQLGPPFDVQPQEQFWPPNDMSWQMQGPYMSGSPIAGPSNGSTPAFEASGSDMPSGSGSQGLSCNPAWLNSTQYSLFDIPPLPFDSKYVSLDSSLSAMVSHFVDATSSRVSLDTTVLNLIDGIPPAEAPSPSQSPEHPPIHQMDSNGTDDGQQDSPLN